MQNKGMDFSKKIKNIGLILVLLFSIYIPGFTQDNPDNHNNENLKLALFIPSQGPFWLNVVKYSQAVANDLDITLEVVIPGADSSLMEEVERVCRDGVDGLIFKPMGDIGEKVLDITETYGIPAFTIDSALQTEGLFPRTKYQNWIGEMYPDPANMGIILLQQLLNQAKAEGITNYNVLSILGGTQGTVNANRIKALEAYSDYSQEVESLIITSAGFKADKAASEFKMMYAENPSINIVWCATDLMARGVISAVKDLGIEKPVFIGGINWDLDSVQAINEGTQAVSVGGHFLEGSWAVLLLHDYLKGIDFSNESNSFVTPILAITQENNSLLSSFLSQDPDGVNFKFYSKKYNPDLQRYTLDLFKFAEKAIQGPNDSSSRTTFPAA